MKLKRIAMMVAAIAIATVTGMVSAQEFYNLSATAQNGEEVPMSDYKGKVVLIVNTASQCGFTPQYADLQALYAEYHDQGLEILDFPCNQFGGQSPETDEQTTQFCQAYFGTEFPQFKKTEVNGPNETPLFAWLKKEKGFGGFDDSELGQLLHNAYMQMDPNYASSPDIKWNFTKFLIDREGNVVKRFEPTDDMGGVKAAIAELI